MRCAVVTVLLVSRLLVAWIESQNKRIPASIAAEQLGGVKMKPDSSNRFWRYTTGLACGIREVAGSMIHKAARRKRSPPKEHEFSSLSVALLPSEEVAKSGGVDKDGKGAGDVAFVEYAGSIFARLRALEGVSESDYLSSFSQGSPFIEFASNSKSSQRFFFTSDGRYMIKTMNEAELASLLRLLPAYEEHIRKEPESLLARLLGAYRVADGSTNDTGIAFVVTSNIFAPRRSGPKLIERYDLKGSYVGRSGRSKSPEKKVSPTAVLKDNDLVDSGKPIRLGHGQKQRLLKQVRKDAKFLCGLDLMDYSLLVGRREPRHGIGKFLEAFFDPLRCQKTGGLEYELGIIDYLQIYNTRKSLETSAKGLIHDKHGISSVPPDEYADRFIAFMEVNFR